MLVIVPWGVIALVQITGLVLGAPASDGVRATTLVALAATAAWAVSEWAIARPAGIARTPEGAGRLARGWSLSWVFPRNASPSGS